MKKLVTSQLSSDNEVCKKFFCEHESRVMRGQYVVRLPFKSNVNNLGESRSTAVKILLGMHKRLTFS